MKKVLFICTGNTCRSPMAEAIFQKLALEKGLDAVAESAGLYANAGDEMSANTRAVLKENGIDFMHAARKLGVELLESCDFVLGMTLRHIIPLVAYDNVECLSAYNDGREIPDPYGQSMNVYRDVYKSLKFAIERFIEQKLLK